MRNIDKISLLTLSILLFGNNCFAQIKFDVTSTVSSVTDEVGKIQEQAQDIMKQGEHMQTFLKMKDGLMEGVGKINELKSQVMGVAGEIKGAVDDVKGAIDDAKGMVNDVKDGIDEAKGMVNDAKDMANGAVQSAQGAVNNATGGLSQAKDMLQLQNQMAQAESNYENRVQNINAEKEAALQKLRENNEILQQMLAEAQGTSASAETSAVQASESAVSASSRVSDFAVNQTAVLDTAKTVAVGEKALVSQDKIKTDAVAVKPTALDVSAKVSVSADKLSMDKETAGKILSTEATAVTLETTSLSATVPVVTKQEKVLTGTPLPTQKTLSSAPALKQTSKLSATAADSMEMSVRSAAEPLSAATLEKTAQPLNSSITSGVLNRKAFTQPSAVQTVTESVKVREAL